MAAWWAIVIVCMGAVLLPFILRDTFRRLNILTPQIWAQHGVSLMPLYTLSNVGGILICCGFIVLGLGVPTTTTLPGFSASGRPILIWSGFALGGLGILCVFFANFRLKRYLRQALSPEDYDDLFPQRS